MLPDYLTFGLIVSYMVVTYRIIAVKYRISHNFRRFSYRSKTFLVVLHVFIVVTNIFLYFWLILRDFNPFSVVFLSLGVLLFVAGVFIVFWGAYFLRKTVFIPGDRLIMTGPFALIRHPVYLGGIVGAVGLAVFAWSLQAVIYSIVLGSVLSYIADAEEGDLAARFGLEYTEYAKRVPKLLPRRLSLTS